MARREAGDGSGRAGFRYPRGIAIIAHPHPLYGGTMNNKVVYTLFKALLELGFITVKFNFRGVGQSEGDSNPGKTMAQVKRRTCLRLSNIRNQFRRPL